MVISALVKSGLSNLTSECLYMCGQRRPPPQLNVYNNSLQVMPVVIKVKRLSRWSETNLSCWSYYSQIKLSCLGQRGCKLWNLYKNTLVLARTSTAFIHRCDTVSVCVSVPETQTVQHVETLCWEYLEIAQTHCGWYHKSIEVLIPIPVIQWYYETLNIFANMISVYIRVLKHIKDIRLL